MNDSSGFGRQGFWYRRGNAIVLREAAWDEGEDEVPRNVEAKVAWKGPMGIARARQEAGGGLYFIRANDTPCYVGQTVSFADRLAAHSRSGRCTYALPDRWQVWIGRVQSTGKGVPAGNDAVRRLRLGVEHAVIRSVINQQKLGGKGTLLNKTSIRPFLVDGVLRVDNVGDIPRVGASPGRGDLGIRGPRGGRKQSWQRVIEGKDGNLFEWRA